MSSFFSGTDTATLKEEGNDRNHFVSLIVNNEGTYTAAITRKVKSTKIINENYSYGSFEDTVVSNTKQYTQETEEIEYFYLDIEKEGSTNDFKEIDERLAEIQKQKQANKESLKDHYCYDKWRNPKYITPSLFEKKMEDHIEKNRMMDIDPDDDIPLSNIEISGKDVKSVVLQLITGSIIIKDDTKIDINKWAKSMPKIYEERFGKGDEGFEKFSLWADQYCEFLIDDKKPEIEYAEEEEAWLSQFTLAVCKELDSLADNEYINELKKILKQWIM